MAMEDEVLEFNFEGITPQVGGTFVTLPKGEYNMQCVGMDKFYAKDKGSKQPNPNRPGLHFIFDITMHPMYEGKTVEIWHMMEQKSLPYLLNTLSCLVPEFDWNKNGLKVPLSSLAQKINGRPCNGLIEWEISVYEGKKRVQNRLQGLKPFDQSIEQPVATEGNPPIINVDAASSPITQQAAAGVSQSEVNEFLNEWPGGSGTPESAPAATPSEATDFFGDDPF